MIMRNGETVKGYDAIEMALINGSLNDALRLAVALSEVTEGFEASEAMPSDAKTVAPVRKAS